MPANLTTLADLVNTSQALWNGGSVEEVRREKAKFLEMIEDIDTTDHMILSVDIVTSLRMRDYDKFRAFVLSMAQMLLAEIQADIEGEIQLPVTEL